MLEAPREIFRKVREALIADAKAARNENKVPLGVCGRYRMVWETCSSGKHPYRLWFLNLKGRKKFSLFFDNPREQLVKVKMFLRNCGKNHNETGNKVAVGKGASFWLHLLGRSVLSSELICEETEEKDIYGQSHYKTSLRCVAALVTGWMRRHVVFVVVSVYGTTPIKGKMMAPVGGKTYGLKIFRLTCEEAFQLGVLLDKVVQVSEGE